VRVRPSRGASGSRLEGVRQTCSSSIDVPMQSLGEAALASASELVAVGAGKKRKKDKKTELVAVGAGKKRKRDKKTELVAVGAGKKRKKDKKKKQHNDELETTKLAHDATSGSASAKKEKKRRKISATDAIPSLDRGGLTIENRHAAGSAAQGGPSTRDERLDHGSHVEGTSTVVRELQGKEQEKREKKEKKSKKSKKKKIKEWSNESGITDGSAGDGAEQRKRKEKKRKEKRSESGSSQSDKSGQSSKDSRRDTASHSSGGTSSVSLGAPTLSAISVGLSTAAVTKKKKSKQEKKESKKKKAKEAVVGSDVASSATACEQQHQQQLPNHSLVLAPMVGGSDLPFRMLCRRYGADLCYTPMM
jgi:hypothetical protein